MKKGIIISAVVASFVITGSIIGACSGSKKGPAYITSTIEKRDVYKTVSATGTLEPVNTVDVGTQVSGIIDRIYVDFNSEVKKGQILAEMDRTTLLAETNSAKAALNSAEVELEYQTKNYNRYTSLHNKGLISDTEYEQAVYSYNKAVEALKVQKSTMSKVNRNLEYATITSPIDGVVLDRAVEEGQTVAAGFNTPTLFTLAADLKEMEVIADVDEADIGYIQEGQRVTFTVDAFPDETFEGTVSQVRLNPQTTSNVVTYEVVVDAPNPDQTLKPGMTANITIYTLSELNAMSVPMKALRFKPEVLPEGYKAPSEKRTGTVWVLEKSALKPYIVSTGINDGAYTVISGDDIKEGMTVVTGIEEEQKSGLFPKPGPGGPGGPEGPGM